MSLTSECGQCGRSFEMLSKHWAQAECERPPMTNRQISIVEGLYIGDGWLNRDSSHPAVSVEMVNRQFIDWLADELSPFANTVRERGVIPDGSKQTYLFRTSSHPDLEHIEAWDDDGKKIPRDYDLDSIAAGVWYCCDGHMNRQSVSPRVGISNKNESERPSVLIEMFEDNGFNPTYSAGAYMLYFPTDETDEVLAWMEGPIPGFERKWRLENE